MQQLYATNYLGHLVSMAYVKLQVITICGNTPHVAISLKVKSHAVVFGHGFGYQSSTASLWSMEMVTMFKREKMKLKGRS